MACLHLRDIFNDRTPAVSFEVFPPKPGMPLDTIFSTLRAVAPLGPDFVSVTYGAGGTTKDATFDIAHAVSSQMGMNAMAHITGLTHTAQQIDALCDRLLDAGICNILAMRGDKPLDSARLSENPDFPHAADLIKHIRSRYGSRFTIAAAAYPEGHIEAPSLEADLQRIKEKADCGADFLVTQLFFDNELFYSFMDKIRKMGINIPVCAGIMPVLAATQINRILSLCGVAFPPKFSRMMARYADDGEALAQAGITFACDQIIDLFSWGVDGVHLYTMNRAKTTAQIMNNIETIRKVRRARN